MSSEKPAKGYPEYYRDFLYKRNVYPKMYFKLGSIEELSKDIFAKCVSLSSRRPLAESIARSMASFFYGEYPMEDLSVSSTPPMTSKMTETKKKEAKAKKTLMIDKQSCVYKKEGLCANKRCISYGYECERPSSCIKQKPKTIGE